LEEPRRFSDWATALSITARVRGCRIFAAIMQVAPRSECETTLDKPLDPRQFLPASRALYRYEGSLTTPPCSEVVDWNVCEQPIEVAAADIAAFKAIFPMNARPLQPVNRRFLLRGV
jgi:carbonic anhydrase